MPLWNFVTHTEYQRLSIALSAKLLPNAGKLLSSGYFGDAPCFKRHFAKVQIKPTEKVTYHPLLQRFHAKAIIVVVL